MGDAMEALRDMSTRATRPTGEQVVEVAMAMLRRVDERMERMEGKLDDISKERMIEAREAGENSARIAALQEFRDDHVDDHKWMWRAIIGSFLAAGASALVGLSNR